MGQDSVLEQIELNIRQQLLSDATLDVVCDRLLRNYQNIPMTREALACFANFFLAAGQLRKLNKYFCEQSLKGADIPWPQFTESLFQSSAAIPETVKSALLAGAKAQKQMEELARSSKLDHFDENLKILRDERNLHLEAKLKQKKTDLLQVAETFFAQGLVDDGEKIVAQLKKLFPDDKSIGSFAMKKQSPEEVTVFANLAPLDAPVRKRKASFLMPEKRDLAAEATLEVIAKAMHQYLEQNAATTVGDDQISADFAIAHIFWENYDSALSFLDSGKELKSNRWLKLEILVMQKRFSELLQNCAELIPIWTKDPNDTIALLYFKARALWGLGQFKVAIDTLESIADNQSNYRDVGILLVEWRSENQ